MPASSPVVDENGAVYDYMREARERGIHFDLGHGAASFWYRAAMPAIVDGFPPDSISTDLHMGNINGHVHSMLDTMSKCLAMNMSLQEVIYRSTVTPASAIRRPELGTLTPALRPTSPCWAFLKATSTFATAVGPASKPATASNAP